jgi:renalase
MSAVGRHPAGDVPMRLDTRITRLTHTGDIWLLMDATESMHGPFHHVIVTLPAPQTAEPLGDHAPAAEARAVPMTPCWTVLAAFERRSEVGWDGAFVHGSPLSWVARNSYKPGRISAADC